MNNKITLSDMLAARESRVQRQNELLQKHNMPLICFTLNIVGDMKRFAEADRAFYEGQLVILEKTKRRHCTHKLIKHKIAFFYVFFAARVATVNNGHFFSSSNVVNRVH
jgi:phosphoribosyl-dephospho-CoA transferase